MTNSLSNRSSDVAQLEPESAAPFFCIQDRPKPRVLLVDDIADNRDLLARRFRKRNYHIVEADCGTSALELIASGTFDTVLLDVMMPDMNGLEVLKRIRATHSPETPPVIMVTANNQSGDMTSSKPWN